MRLGIEGAEAALAEERKNEGERFPDAFYRLVWLMVDQDNKFLPLNLTSDDIPLGWKFVDGNKRLEPAPKAADDPK